MTPAGYFWTTYLSALTISGLSLLDIAPRLIWNASASVPVGLYTLRPEPQLITGDLVAVDPPEPLAAFMVERGYVASGVPLLKHIAAMSGQRVCRTGGIITVDGRETGEALDRDRMGRDLPVWQGCRIVAEGEIFLMNMQVRDSLDGRYFGPIPASSIIGRALPLWTDPDSDGRYEWRAPMQ
ncbi:S26 family signal peptidase [Paenirhodobacter populi]|uniref:S26 family signal peptidase n=1 Tax=Paenirhodobacter populi TaxID=2306993 RepID=A0A443JGG3_9RHOB|nr:S26 family signal peptidase [Sinirhodobacter populi]RWR19504.1 S26 family signal peptidase [Sinirhodobacter populi]